MLVYGGMEGRIDDIKRLLKRGFKVNSKEDHGEVQGVTALHLLRKAVTCR